MVEEQRKVNAFFNMRLDSIALERSDGMVLERGVETKGFRLRLLFQSADGDAHSIMSDDVERFGAFADRVADFARGELAAFMEVRPSSKERLLP